MNTFILHSLFTHASFTEITKQVLTMFQVLLSNISIPLDTEIPIEVATSLAMGHGVKRRQYVTMPLLDVKRVICYH